MYLIGALLLLVSATPANASGFLVNLSFGGVIYDTTPTLESQPLSGGVNGSYTVTIEAQGPQMYRSLRPFASYDHHWSGHEGVAAITTETDVFSFGVSGSFRLGHAQATLFGGTAYFGDRYRAGPIPQDIVTLESPSWGGVIGANIRFRFFERIDSLLGYKAMFREKPVFTGESPGEEPYEVVGNGLSHCFSFGFGFRLGEV